MGELQADLTEAREELTEAQAEMVAASATLAAAPPLPVAPPTDIVIHDIADDDEDVPSRFECADDQTALLASFESLPGDAQRR
jgi:AmiR/NasT family two-component response regulator